MLDNAQIEIKLDEQTGHDVIAQLLCDGAELRLVLAVLSPWFLKHGYVFTPRPHLGQYRAQHANGIKLETNHTWFTAHEMIADLLKLIEDGK